MSRLAHLLLRAATALNGGACPCDKCAAIRRLNATIARATTGMSRQRRRELHRDSWESMRR